METTCITTEGLRTEHYAFFWQIVNSNIEYLAISVGVIIGAGIFLSILLYFVNFRPMSKRLTDHEEALVRVAEDIESERESNQSKLDALTEKQQDLLIKLESDQVIALLALKEEVMEENKLLDQEVKDQLSASLQSVEDTLTEQVKSVDKKIVELNKLAQEIELDTKWIEHYVWKARDTDSNVLMTLNEYLELCLKYGATIRISLCLQIMLIFLQDTKKLNNGHTGLRDTLIALLDRVDGHNEVKAKIVEKSNEVFSRKPGE